MPNIRILPESIPSKCTVREDIEIGISAVLDDIVGALTRPLTAEEESPQPKEAGKPSRIIFTGNLEEVNYFFYRRGWSDGLPVIPPTEEAVAEMLTGTDLPPDHLLGKMEPRLGKVTVEKIAINAVMAGALPTYMPVLIAGVKALWEPEAMLHWLHSSAASPGALWVINGPIRNDLRVNSGRGALSPGDMANAAIGRAMGLIIKNIGGARKGIEEAGGMGNPAKNTMVIGENEEASPWEPLHVEHGFNKEDSTITEFTTINSFNQTGGGGTDVKGILSGMVSGVRAKGTLGEAVCFMLTPPNARILSREGWTKKDVKVWISENATVPYRPDPRVKEPLPPWQERQTRRLPFNAGDPVRLLPDPDGIMIVVAGDSWPGSGAVVPGGISPSRFVTKKIELPASWGKLVKKYQNIVPTYALY